MSELGLPLGVTFVPLKKISHPKGDVFHALKSSEPQFEAFGEAYFTTVHNNETKGWKKHTRMVLNLIVIHGSVEVFFCDDQGAEVNRFTFGRDNYGRLTIPAGIWLAFSGRSDEINLMLNIASIEHDPEEAINAPLSKFPTL